MDFSQNTGHPLRRTGGIVIVFGVHLLAATALIAHLAHKKSAAIVSPIETRLIEETKLAPPKTPPLPPPRPKPSTPPPPSFMPPPEVQLPQQQALDAIRQTTGTVPPDTPFKPSAPAAVLAPATAAPTAASGPPIPGFAELSACKPDYPRASLMAEEQGTVKLQFVVGANGQLVRSAILKSSGYPALDKATVKALSRCRFRAAERDGVKIESTFAADWVWKLD